MENEKQKDEIEEFLNNNDPMNFEVVLKEDGEKIDTSPKENAQEEISNEKEEPKEEKNKETSSEQIPEVDERTITPEIIEILKKDIFKKYIKGEKQIMKLKIKTEENFLENQTLINVADLLGIKTISFHEISTNIFNSLLTSNSLLVKKFNRIKKEKEQELDKKEGKEESNEIKEEISLEEIIFNNCQIDIDYSSIFPLIKNSQ